MLDREFHIRFKLSDIGKLLCFSPIVVCLIYLIICLPWSSEYAPAWVQAIGSIGAIVGAIWISSGQARRDETVRNEREWGYLCRAFETSLNGLLAAKALGKGLENYNCDPVATKAFLDEVGQSLQEIERFSYAEMVDIDFANSFMVQGRRLKFLANLASACIERPDGVGNVKDGVERLRSGAAELLERLNAYGTTIGKGPISSRKI